MIKITRILLLLAYIIAGCSTPQRYSSTITLTGDNYDAEKDQTPYMVLPYGSVKIPGEWFKSGYNKSSRQQFFRNKDSVTIAVAFGPVNSYEFNPKGAFKGNDFIDAFYKWEKEYFSKAGLTVEIKERNRDIPFLIWRVYGIIDGTKTDNYYISESNGCFKSFGIFTDKWAEEKKLQFLKSLNAN